MILRKKIAVTNKCSAVTKGYSHKWVQGQKVYSDKWAQRQQITVVQSTKPKDIFTVINMTVTKLYINIKKDNSDKQEECKGGTATKRDNLKRRLNRFDKESGQQMPAFSTN